MLMCGLIHFTYPSLLDSWDLRTSCLNSTRRHCHYYATVSRDHRNVRGPHVWLAATYAQMGKLAEGRAAVAEVMRIEPNFSISGTTRVLVTFKNPDDDQHYFDGLRKAGLPE